jgi:hypothetical protein
MWALRNRTAYGAERTWTRDKDGVHVWLVAVKATFSIDATGRTVLADEQPPPLQLPEYVDEPAASSLRYEADLVPPKPTTDVLILGSAHALHGGPAPFVDVSCRVGPIEKSLRVLGPRFFGRSGHDDLSAPEPFVEFPLTYEWAYGGTDTTDPDPRAHAYDPRNPIGKGFAVRPASLVDSPAWRIEPIVGNAAAAGPAGLGPIAGWWSPRRERAGTYDEAWERDRKPLLPADYDDRFVQCAPRDQQTPQPLRGGEPVRLENLTPDGVLELTLPKIYPMFTTFVRRERHVHRPSLGTVILEPDLRRLQMVWQSSLRVSAIDDLDETVVWEKRYL